MSFEGPGPRIGGSGTCSEGSHDPEGYDTVSDTSVAVSGGLRRNRKPQSLHSQQHAVHAEEGAPNNAWKGGGPQCCRRLSQFQAILHVVLGRTLKPDPN